MKTRAARATSHPTERPRVFFIPDFRHGNPYQQRLADELGELGFEVRFSSHDARRTLLLQFLRWRPIEIIHVHWPENYLVSDSALLALLRTGLLLSLLRLARLRGTKIVWTIHNVEFHDWRHPRLEAKARRWLAGLCHGLAVHFAAAEPLVRKHLGVRPEIPVVLTPLGGDPPSLGALERRSNDASPFVFCHFGELRRYKNVPFIVEAFRRLERRDVRLLIAGRVHEPALERTLTRHAAGDPRIELRLGYLADEELEACLLAADAFVLGSDEFFTSASALQAAGWAMVVVAPEHPHLASFLAPEGWVRYAPGDVEDLSRALAVAAAGQCSGKANRGQAERFTYASLAASTGALYRRVLGGEP